MAPFLLLLSSSTLIALLQLITQLCRRVSLWDMVYTKEALM